jgi:nucleoporin SEH1
MALITRDGHLSVYEPVDSGNLAEWQTLYDMYVCSTSPRSGESGFKVSWHKEKLPCWTAVMAGLDRKSLGLAVAVGEDVKIYRTDKSRKLYLAAELGSTKSIIRDVDWANGSMKGWDTIATASKDGAVRIYELTTLSMEDPTALAHNTNVGNAASATSANRNNTLSRKVQSGIGAGLASATSKGFESQQSSSQTDAGQIKHTVHLVAELKNSHGVEAVWRVKFTQMGRCDFVLSSALHYADVVSLCRRSSCLYRRRWIFPYLEERRRRSLVRIF